MNTKRTRPLSSLPSRLAQSHGQTRRAIRREARAAAVHARPEARHEVSVTRAGVTRSTILGERDAQQTVHDAVRLGLPVTHRRLADDEPGFPGIREKAVR